jgi:hypothetical protein
MLRCYKQDESIATQNRNIGQGEPRHIKFKRWSNVRPLKCLDFCSCVSYKWWSMSCCTEPRLTRPSIYCIYIKCMTCKIKKKKKKKNLTIDNYCWQWLTRDRLRPLVREGAQQRQDSKIQIELISGRKSDSGIEAKTYWLTDRPSVVTWLQLQLQWHRRIELWNMIFVIGWATSLV